MLLIISLCAFLAACLTVYSGFGLGTLLMPIIDIFFPLPIAIAMTAFVHFLNNIFKFLLLRKAIQWNATLKFALPAIIAAVPGAILLNYLSDLPPLFSYSLFHTSFTMTPIKIVIGLLLIIFSTLELRSMGESLIFKSKWLPVGGLISGFFGGLSGQQGAFRAPFLLHLGLTKEQFVATSAGIALLVDATRLITYSMTFQNIWSSQQLSFTFLLTVVFAAFLGSMVGVIGLTKVTFSFIQYLVATLLYVLGTLILFGVI